VEEWLACETVWTPATERHRQLLGELLKLPAVHGNLVPDAHLAALAIEHRFTLCSSDGDFARFRCAGSTRSAIDITYLSAMGELATGLGRFARARGGVSGLDAEGDDRTRRRQHGTGIQCDGL
jgi:hypothetical protein